MRGLGAPNWPGDVLYIACALLWAGLTVGYVVERWTRRQSFRDDLENPITGPILATIPVVGIMLVTHWVTALGPAAPWLDGVLVVALGAIAVVLMSHWIANPLHYRRPSSGVLPPVRRWSFHRQHRPDRRRADSGRHSGLRSGRRLRPGGRHDCCLAPACTRPPARTSRRRATSSFD